MGDLKIVVCMKVVPKPEEIRVDTDTGLLQRDNVRTEINPPDMNAMEMALRLKDRYGGEIMIISMAPNFYIPQLRVPLAMGADHIYLLSDRAFGGADTLATTYTLAAGIQKIGNVDIVFCGEESSDGATGQVPPGIATWLNIHQITMATDVEVNTVKNVIQGRREIKGGHEILQVPLPAVISAVTACNEPRFMDFQIKSWAFDDQRVTIWDKNDLDVDSAYIGQVGSPTVVSGLIQAATKDRRRQFLTGSPREISRQLAEILITVQ